MLLVDKLAARTWPAMDEPIGHENEMAAAEFGGGRAGNVVSTRLAGYAYPATKPKGFHKLLIWRSFFDTIEKLIPVF